MTGNERRCIGSPPAITENSVISVVVRGMSTCYQASIRQRVCIPFRLQRIPKCSDRRILPVCIRERAGT